MQFRRNKINTSKALSAFLAMTFAIGPMAQAANGPLPTLDSVTQNKTKIFLGNLQEEINFQKELLHGLKNDSDGNLFEWTRGIGGALATIYTGTAIWRATAQMTAFAITGEVLSRDINFIVGGIMRLMVTSTGTLLMGKITVNPGSNFKLGNTSQKMQQLFTEYQQTAERMSRENFDDKFDLNLRSKSSESLQTFKNMSNELRTQYMQRLSTNLNLMPKLHRNLMTQITEANQRAITDFRTQRNNQFFQFINVISLGEGGLEEIHLIKAGLENQLLLSIDFHRLTSALNSELIETQRLMSQITN